jgi:hypothetical protein
MMHATIEFVSKSDEAKALGIILEHSPGMVFRGPRGPRYVLKESAVELLRDAGVNFNVLGTSAPSQVLSEAAGARI